MKNVSLLLIGLLLISTAAQTSGYTYELDQSLKRQKAGGIVMVSAGAAALIGGVVLAAAGKNDSAPIYGTGIAVIGLSVNVIGIISLIKVKRQREDLKEIDNANHPISAGTPPVAPATK